MAGITNIAFRKLCREYGAGLYVCEMVTTRALVERNPKTMRMLAFSSDERPRSLQLYGIDPAIVGRAVRMIVEENLADHVDLNFGCPVPKVTRKGGGSALPWRWRLFERIVRAAVEAATPAGIPVTIKMRKGIDDDHLTYLRAGRIAQDAGVAAVALHGRTAAQRYSGHADWDAIANLKAHLEVPVLGNGDIWEASDALRMVDETGCAGVIVGRGCLGRPWLFRDLAVAFAGGEALNLPTLGEVATVMRRHGDLLAELMGELRGLRDFRKHVPWYLKGFPAGGELRAALGMVDSLVSLDNLLSQLDPNAPFPVQELGSPRGRQGSPRDHVVLPHGWLDDTDGLTADLTEAELGISGG
jgi:nifR3 family TIM-barrel protein